MARNVKSLISMRSKAQVSLMSSLSISDNTRISVIKLSLVARGAEIGRRMCLSIPDHLFNALITCRLVSLCVVFPAITYGSTKRTLTKPLGRKLRSVQRGMERLITRVSSPISFLAFPQLISFPCVERGGGSDGIVLVRSALLCYPCVWRPSRL